MNIRDIVKGKVVSNSLSTISDGSGRIIAEIMDDAEDEFLTQFIVEAINEKLERNSPPLKGKYFSETKLERIPSIDLKTVDIKDVSDFIRLNPRK